MRSGYQEPLLSPIYENPKKMRNQRRLRPVFLFFALVLLTVLYVTGSARRTRQSEFYTKTTDALAAKHNAASRQNSADPIANLADDAKRSEVRHEREEMERGRQQVLAAQPAQESVGSKSVAGRIKVSQAATSQADKNVDGVAKVGNTQATMAAKPDGTEAGPESREDHEVEMELNSILKKSPIIIFSKTFCPFSKKAKRILVDSYKITPAPYVVELDEHPMGDRLQKAIATMTGRRTVPNILISGRSIGGGDEVEALHLDGKIIDKVKSMAGKRIMEARLLDPPEEKDEVKRKVSRRRRI